jgi:hypothetical protein
MPRLRTRWSRFVVVPFVLAAACADAAIDETPDETLEATLRAPVDLSLFGTDGIRGSSLEIDASRDASVGHLDIAVTSGGVSAQLIDDQLVLRTLAIHLADVSLPSTVVPDHGATLTDVSLELEVAANAPFVRLDGALVAEPIAALDLHWSILKDGELHALADVELEDVDLVVTLAREGELTTLEIAGGHDGPLWTWLDHFGLENLRVALVGSSDPIVE